jgi:CCR4-NOT transcription complex subunit 1
LEVGKRVIANLQASTAEASMTPPNTGHKDQLEYIFDEWVHLQLPETPKKTIGAFIYQLHKQDIMQSQETSIEFIRTCIDASVTAYEQEQSLPYGTGTLDTATVKIDALGKLIVDLVAYQDEHEGGTKDSKSKYLDQMLVVTVLVLCNHHNTRGDAFNQKVFFRLFSTILFRLNEATKEETLAEHKADLFVCVARALLILQPSHFQRFTFSWLTLVAHRIFIPAMLEGGQSDERWDVYARLMETLLVFTGQLIKPTGETVMAQNFYRGVLRVLLVIHHDYPEFLVEHHFRLCNSIPMHCTQLRNLIVSAYPSTILEMPDPFTAGLKVDRLENNLQAPVIRTDIVEILSKAGIKSNVDNLLKAMEPKAQDIRKVCDAIYFPQAKESGFELVPTTADPALIHALVLYIGVATLGTETAKAPLFDEDSAAARLMVRLVKDLHPEAKFHFISAIANQLRYPNTHTHFFSYALLHLFGPPNDDEEVLEIQQTITRVLLERLLVHRPHPWGLIITLLEILKNRIYAFWDLPFVKAAPEVREIMSGPFHAVILTPRAG